MKIKKEKNNFKFVLIATFFIAVCFCFGNVKNVGAADETLGTCSYRCPGSSEEIVREGETYTAASCDAFCNQTICDGKKPAECFIEEDGILWNTKNYASVATSLDRYNNTIGKADRLTQSIPTRNICPNLYLTDMKSWLNCFLLYILAFLGMILQLSGNLFSWLIEPQNILTVINNQEIYKAWAFVRDLLNITFILFLLFSAFATVFQVDRYSYKSTLKKMIIMALLVNFSYPITRFVIDLSNVLMFYLMNSLDVNKTIFAQAASNSLLPEIIAPSGNPDTHYLIAAIVFVFIFTVTLFIIAALLLVRTVALALLVVFSSIAFIGEAIPQLSSYASDWWKKLFKYAFFGPAMMFMLVVSTKMMASIGSSGFGNMEKIANLNSNDPNYIASISFFVIPIVILWMGIGVAQTMGIEGAGMIVGKGKKFMNWSKRNLTGYSTGKFLLGATGIPGGAKEGWKNFKKTGKFFGKKVPLYGGSDQTERMEARFGGLFKDSTKGWTDANIELERKKVNEKRKEWKDQGAIDKESVYEKLQAAGSSSIERKAAALEITENHSFKDYEQFKAAAHAIGEDKVLRKIFDDKTKDKHIRFVIKSGIEKKRKEALEKGESFGEKEEYTIYEENFNKLDNDKFAKQSEIDIEDTNVVKYIGKRYVENPSNHQDVFRKLNGKKQAQWVDKKIAPSDKTTKRAESEKTPKRSYEDIQRERAKKAQDEINKQNFS